MMENARSCTAIPHYSETVVVQEKRFQVRRQERLPRVLILCVAKCSIRTMDWFFLMGKLPCAFTREATVAPGIRCISLVVKVCSTAVPVLHRVQDVPDVPAPLPLETSPPVSNPVPDANSSN